MPLRRISFFAKRHYGSSAVIFFCLIGVGCETATTWNHHVNDSRTNESISLPRPVRENSVAVPYSALYGNDTLYQLVDGRMQRLWGFRNGRSNIYVFDAKRRLIWKSTGPLSRKRARQFIRMIRRLTR